MSEFQIPNSPFQITRSYLVAAALLVIAATGALYQSISVRREAARFPPPGRLVDVGGRRLHLLCIGQGEPTVIFEPSGLGGAVSAERARTEIAATTRVCSYDRMGMGWSDPGPAVISIGMFADDLERLTDRAGLRPPYVLVPASMGGLVAELFTRRHPAQVAGLVFADAADSATLERIAHRATWTLTQASCLPKIAARFGLLRLVDPLGLRRQAPDDAERVIARIYRVEPMATFCGMVRGLPDTLQELRAAPPFPSGVPLTVLTAESTRGLLPPGYESAGRELARDWRELQHQLSRRSSRGTWRIVSGSDHLMGNSQPHAVASAVLEMLQQIHGARP